MKRLNVIICLVLVVSGGIGISYDNANADIIPGGIKPGFMGCSTLQVKEVGKETYLEEFVFLADQSFANPQLVDRTLELNCHLTLTAKLNEVYFTGAEGGDPWWEVSALIRRDGEWNYLSIHIKGQWNPFKQGADKWGRSSVVQIKLIPLKEENSVLFHNSLFNIDLTRQIGTKSTDSPENMDFQTQINKELQGNSYNLNGDIKVDILDLVIIAGGNKPNPRDPVKLDLNQDGKVDILDWVEKAKQQKEAQAAPPRPSPKSRLATTWGKIRAR